MMRRAAALAGVAATLAAGCVPLMQLGAPRSATATIVAKAPRPPSTYYQYLGGGTRSDPDVYIPIAAAYVFTLRVDGFDDDLRYAVNTVAAEEFAAGQTVCITVVMRGIPLVWSAHTLPTCERATSSPSPRLAGRVIWQGA